MTITKFEVAQPTDTLIPLTTDLGELNRRREWFYDRSRPEKDNLGPHVVVVDDFYVDPYKIRELALNMEYQNYVPPPAEQVGKETGVIYLSPDAPESAGTTLWREKSSGLCVAPYGSHFTAEYSKFELAYAVHNRFNRLVLFRENVLHRAEHGFGNNRTARLTQTLFFLTDTP